MTKITQGTFLEWLCKELKEDIRELTKELGWSRQRRYEYLKNKSVLNRDDYPSLASALGITTKELFSLDYQYYSARYR